MAGRRPAAWGEAVCAAVEGAEDMTLTGRADPALGVAVPTVLGDADVLVDFTRPDTALDNARAGDRGPACTSSIGTTGFDADGAARDRRGVATGAKAFVAPNFAIGAVLMMRFAAEASRFMARAEIIELHHPAKLDAPSGTAAAHRRDDGRRRADPLGPPAGHRRRPGGHPRRRQAQTLTICATRPRTARASCPACCWRSARSRTLPESPDVGLERLLWLEG